MQVLGELEAGDKAMMVVLNKWDLVESNPALAEQQSLLTLRFPDSVKISAKNSQGLEIFLDTLAAKINEHRPCHYFLVPYDVVTSCSPAPGGQVLSQETCLGNTGQGIPGRTIAAIPSKQGVAISTSPNP